MREREKEREKERQRQRERERESYAIWMISGTKRVQHMWCGIIYSVVME